MNDTKYIASCSFGKDSCAMVLKLINENMQLDEVIFYDTGAEFNAIYNVRDTVVPILNQKGIKYTEIKPERPFFYDMLEKPVYSKKNGNHCGYGWYGGVTRWGTTEKTKQLDKYKQRINANIIEYVGIAADETKRINGNIERGKTLPLVDWGMTEKDCLDYCYSEGINWNEDGVELYDILDRVSCWCCSNKNLKELRNIYKYLPNYWDKLKVLQNKIDKPYRRNGNGIFDLEKRFNLEERYIQDGKSITNKEFFNELRSIL